ncbi:NAD(P)-dependent alcohol dehydrogenase [Streptomyces sp. NPDC048172]|uniref:NAD(P)-dependent alcohol dehydrogenase n=1 Tax=Streptomyces sp. NPDC048172 TaxID=3365505 RepID=UPI00372012D3
MSEMRAALYDRFGPPEVLYEAKVPAPVPAPGEVLVRVRAVGVNGGELHGRSGHARLVTGRRFPQRTGIDFTGEVAGSSGVHGLKEGERVWGILPRGRFGSAAEYVAVRPRHLALAPRDLSPEESVSLLAGGTTALTALRDKARLRPGERLLVRGAAGGVGSVAVQLGKALGAHVTALAGPRGLEYVRELGADTAVDRTALGDPSELGTFDVVLDTAGSEHAAYRRLLAPGGRMVAIAFDMTHPVRALAVVLASARHGSRRIRAFSGDPRHDLLAEVTALVDSGALRPVVDTVHELSAIAEAHRALEAGGVRGKHVLRVA